jgi:hypothetical protein
MLVKRLEQPAAVRPLNRSLTAVVAYYRTDTMKIIFFVWIWLWNCLQ